jgi:uncharacterized membrane-anchored protein
LAFWVIKVAATTLGETGGDALSMTMQLGYALSTSVFFTLFMVTVAAQVASKSFHPFLYWGVIVATTTAGTTMADVDDNPLRPAIPCPWVLALSHGLGPPMPTEFLVETQPRQLESVKK